MNRKDHWERIYGTKQLTQVSWYLPRLERSLAMIQANAPLSAAIIDVGGGASTLVDDLLSLGYTAVSVLDISSAALTESKKRLGNRAEEVNWILGDVTRLELPEAGFDFWHDRAVFHFLTERADREAYAKQLTRSLEPGEHALIATFAVDGPKRCSGLDIVRYSADTLGRELGPSFVLEREEHETHRTPSGTTQSFLYCLFKKTDG